MVRKLTPEDLEDVRRHVESGDAIVCLSRCMVCARRTPHGVCHAHADHNNWPKNLDRAWGKGYELEPEACDDPACPLWATSQVVFSRT